jgi:hypothetical protein
MARKNGNGGAAGQGAQAAPPAGAAPQPAQSTQSTPAQGFDPQQIIQALQLVGEYGPGAMVFFQRLLDILRSRAQEVQGREGRVCAARSRTCTAAAKRLSSTLAPRWPSCSAASAPASQRIPSRDENSAPLQA